VDYFERDVGGQTSDGATESSSFLVIDFLPIPWAIPANYVRRILEASAWSESAVDLDALFASAQEYGAPASVISLESVSGTVAVVTRRNLRLESFPRQIVTSLPELVFGSNFRTSTTKHLILPDNGQPLLVLDVCAFTEHENPQHPGSPTLSTTGDLVL
jgi:hypothetical protein